MVEDIKECSRDESRRVEGGRRGSKVDVRLRREERRRGGEKTPTVEPLSLVLEPPRDSLGPGSQGRCTRTVIIQTVPAAKCKPGNLTITSRDGACM